MAYVRIIEPIHWLGKSTDDKPTGATAGSTATETDTGVKWIFDGTDWVEDLTLIYALSEALGA